MLLHDFPGPHAAHGLASGVENDVVRGRVGEGATFLDPGAQIFLGLAAERYQALLVALADGRKPFVVQVQLRKLDA